MVSTATLERQIEVGGELLGIVGTMKGLAAVSIYEFEETVEALREYTRNVELALQMVFSRRPDLVPVPTQPGAGLLAIVVGTDQGMCGAVNRELAEETVRHLARHRSGSAHLARSHRVVGLGARLVRELDGVGVAVDEEVQLAWSVEGIGPLVEDLIVRIDRWRRTEGLDRVLVIHQQPLQRTRRTLSVHQVLPPDAHRLGRIAARAWPTRMQPDTPHRWEDVLTGLLRQDLLVALYRAVAEARAAEHGARLAAMQMTEQNIEERLDRLRRQFHQVRQAQITSELLDVVSGYEALRQVDD